MSDEIYDGVDGEDVANLYDELYTFITDYANAESTEQAKFKKKYPKKYGTIRRLIVNEIHSSNKAEGGIVGLYSGGQVDDFGDYSSVGDDAPSVDSGSASDSDSGSDDNYSDLDTALDDTRDYQAGLKSMQKNIDDNPQLNKGIGKALIGDRIKELIGQGNTNVTRDEKGRITGVYHSAPQLPGPLSGLASLFGITTGGQVYTGYGKPSEIPDSGDSGEEPSKMIRKIVEEKKKEEDIPLTQAELDYFGRGLGTASKPMKTLADINEFIGGLYKDTASPTGAKLSKDKRYLTLPNGKVLDLRTGRRVESLEGLELFKGGLV